MSNLNPMRQTYKVKKNDILVSRLEGNISYTIISEENTDNIIVSNGLCIIRLNSVKFAETHKEVGCAGVVPCA